MTRRIQLLWAGTLVIGVVVASVLISGVVPFQFAVSDHHGDREIDIRVQARQTNSGQVEVRAQSSLNGSEWKTHRPQSRFLPAEPELGRWYSSSSVALSVARAEPDAPDVPDVSDEAGYTQFFVAQAIDYYERHGREATFSHYNTPASAVGQWYVFIMDEDGIIVAHQNADLLGLEDVDVVGPDGYPAGRMVTAVASPQGSWVDYQFINLDSGQAEIKHSWVVSHDGLTIGSGWYEDAPSQVHSPGAYTQSYVERALEMYRVLGREATLEYYSTPDSADGQWYMFIHQTDGTRVAHAYRSTEEGWLGSNIGDTGIDVTGYDYGNVALAIEETGWISYVFVNPDDADKYQQKHSWIVTRDGLQFGSGWYDRNYDLAAHDPAGYSRVLVREAIDLYDAEGREATLEHYNSSDSADGEWYVFVIDGEGQFIAHPTRPDLVGELLQDRGTDVAGFDFGSAFLAITDSEWVSYVFGNPDTGQNEQKHTWLVRHEGLLFGAGWYEAGAYESPDS